MKSKFTPRIASETFGTSIMKTDEAFLFIKAATENGSDLETAYEDMKMVDNLLHVKQLYTVVHVSASRTRAGYTRRGHGLLDALSNVIDARLKGTQ
jgi:hypothetical protein